MRPVALLDALQALPTAPITPRGGKCSVGILLARLDEKEAGALRQLLDERPDVESSAIAQVLQDEGHRVASTTLARHRRRAAGNGCRCPR